MKIDFSRRNAVVYRTNDNNTHFVKISFPEVGLYIDGIRVVHFNDSQEFRVYLPKIRSYEGKWDSNYEFDKSCELWQLIEDEVIDAVIHYGSTR